MPPSAAATGSSPNPELLGASPLPHVHVVGVGGVGMNPLAQALRMNGYRVTGSDRFADQGDELPVFDGLRRGGIELVPQNGSAITPCTRAVAISTAIEHDNPELIAARACGVNVVHRAEMLASLIPPGMAYAIAGTSGKTTTTGMTGWLLDACAVPSCTVNGGAVLNWVDLASGIIGNTHQTGRARPDRPWVVEVDESDRSLLRFFPQHAALTTVSADHFSLEETCALFRTFADQVTGSIVTLPETAARLGEHPSLDAAAIERVDDNNGRGFRWRGRVFRVALPGAHNVANAFLAVRLAELAGADLDQMAEALPRFRGIERRLERVNPGEFPAVYDDYGHNPEKIEAAWHAIRPDASRMIGVWRPHGYTPLAAMAADLGDTFARMLGPEDRIIVLPVFYAGGTVSRALDSRAFVESLQQRGVRVEFLESPDELLAESGFAHSFDAMIVMGARDPDLPRFARRVAAHVREAAL